MNDLSGNQIVASYLDNFKNLVVIIPIVATAIAVSYDVGFFYGISISFFTFFTLAEHITFAFQALPSALIVAGWIVSAVWIGVYLSERDGAFLQKWTEEIGKLDAEGLKKARSALDRKRFWLNIGNWIWNAAVIALAAMFLVAGLYAVAFWIVLTSIVFHYWYRHRASRPYQIFVAALILAMPVCLPMAFGMQAAALITKATAPTDFIITNEGDLKVIIVRAGDRGILYRSPDTKSLGFVKWDAVKQLRTL